MRIPGKKNQTIWIFLCILVAMSIGFFIPVSSAGWIGYVIKSVLFLFIFIVLYILVIAEDRNTFTTEKKEPDTVAPEVTISDDAIMDGEVEEGFGEAFRYFYQEFVGVVQNSVAASWAGLYLRKGDNLEFLTGENRDKTIQARMPVPNENIVSHVAEGNKSILEGNLPIGMTLAGIPNSEMRSFCGVPLEVSGQSVGVLAVGSEATENFSTEDQEFLLRCGKLITQVMSICRKGLHWEMDQGIYQIHVNLEKGFETAVEEQTILSLFVEGIKKVFSFDRFTFCTREGDGGTIRFVYGTIDGLEEGYRFPLDEGLNGWILKRNAPLLIVDLEEGDYIRPRYSRDENPKHGLRSFLGIPLGSESEGAWANISLESKQAGQFTEKGKDVLSTLIISLQFSLERIRLHRQIQDLVKKDPPANAGEIQTEL